MIRIYEEYEKSSDIIYHGSVKASKILRDKGFNTPEVSLTNSKYDAEGYGSKILSIPDSVLTKLNIREVTPSDEPGWSDPDNYPDNDGITYQYPGHGVTYCIRNVTKLNSDIEWENCEVTDR